jgi:hemerythrin-like domain-containing protein
MQDEDRRRFMLGAGALVLSGCAKATDARGTTVTSAEHEEEVSPAEDLMREHGVLNRVLLVYEEGVRRLGRDVEAAAPTTMEGIAGGAEIIGRFVEQYHEKLEEDFLFPRFEKAGKLVELVATLRRQHRAGRTLTESIRRLANPTTAGDPAARQKLAETMQLFVRMYRPHEAREDTVLFPALPSVIRPKELEELGEQFEKKEHELFGKEGFEGIVEQVARIERALGIHDLNQFTPPT